MAYIAPIHYPSGVRLAEKLRFLNEHEDCLVIARFNRLTFYNPTPSGLSKAASTTVHGRVTFLRKLTPLTSPTEHLFVGTDRCLFFCIQWNAESQSPSVFTINDQPYWDLTERQARISQTGERCWVDPTGHYMTVELYEGIIHTFSLVKKQGKRLDPIHSGVIVDLAWSRIPEYFVKSSTFLYRKLNKGENPKLALLWQDYNGDPHIRIRQIDFTPQFANKDPEVEYENVEAAHEQRISRTGLKQKQELDLPLDKGVSHLIALPEAPYGVLVLSDVGIAYYDDLSQRVTYYKQYDFPALLLTAWARIDPFKYALGDDSGNFYYLTVEVTPDQTLGGWKIDRIGKTSVASTIIHIHDSLFFIGSHQGDCMLVNMVQGPETTVELLGTLPNLGPIFDFKAMAMGNRSEEGQGNEYSMGQVRFILGSGGWVDGSLRTARSGVLMDGQGPLMTLEHATDIFGLRCTPGQTEQKDTMLLSFLDETRVFVFDEEGLIEEVSEHKGIDFSEQTVLADNLAADRILQVTTSSVRIVDLESGMVTTSWTPSQGQLITAASTNGDMAAVCVAGKEIITLDLINEISVAATRKFVDGNQIACIGLSSLLPNVCFVGFWEGSGLFVLKTDSLDTLQTVSTSEDDVLIPRSVVLTKLSRESPRLQLFVATANGHVVSLNMDPSTCTLSSPTTTVLGTKPVALKEIPNQDGTFGIFAVCENSTLIYSEGDSERLAFSAVTENISTVCSFNCKAFPGAILFATDNMLRLGYIGSQRHTHIRSLPVHAIVRQLDYSGPHKLFVHGTISRSTEDPRMEPDAITSKIVISDENLMAEIDSHELQYNELLECISPIQVDGVPHFVVGTSFVNGEDSSGVQIETKGRILIFDFTSDRKLNLVSQLRLKSQCRCLAEIDGMIVAALVKTVAIFAIKKDAEDNSSQLTLRLQKKASYRVSTTPIDVSVSGSLIAVADLMKSVAVLRYHRNKSRDVVTLTEEARHHDTVWSTALASIGETSWLLGDSEGNLIVLEQELEGVTENDRRRLKVRSELCTGQTINRIRRIEVKTRPGAVAIPKAFVATREGGVYLFAQIAQSAQNLLIELQARLSELPCSAGDLPFAPWRAFRSQVREMEEPLRFVDGEMIEHFLLLEDEVQEQMVKGLGSRREVVEIVEALQRLH